MEGIIHIHVIQVGGGTVGTNCGPLLSGVRRFQERVQNSRCGELKGTGVGEGERLRT